MAAALTRSLVPMERESCHVPIRPGCSSNINGFGGSLSNVNSAHVRVMSDICSSGVGERCLLIAGMGALSSVAECNESNLFSRCAVASM